MTAGTVGARERESLAIGVAGIGSAVSMIASLFAFRLHCAPIAGPGSFGQFSAVLAAILTIVVFAFGRSVARDPDRRLRAMDAIDLCVMGLAYAVVALLTWTLLSSVIAKSIVHAHIHAVPLVFVAAAVGAVTGYLVFHSAVQSSHLGLVVLLAVFVAEGLVASMLSASDPGWWHDNLSALGMTDDFSALAFNLTLIVAGVTITTLSRSIARAMPAATARGVVGIRFSLVSMGVLLAMVGIFPVDDWFLAHTLSASGMAVVFAVLALRAPSWVPTLTRGCIWVGRAFVFIIMLTGVLYFLDRFTLTAVELIAAFGAFSWIFLFLRSTSPMSDVEERAGGVTVSSPAG